MKSLTRMLAAAAVVMGMAGCGGGGGGGDSSGAAATGFVNQPLYWFSYDISYPSMSVNILIAKQEVKSSVITLSFANVLGNAVAEYTSANGTGPKAQFHAMTDTAMYSSYARVHDMEGPQSQLVSSTPDGEMVTSPIDLSGVYGSDIRTRSRFTWVDLSGKLIVDELVNGQKTDSHYAGLVSSGQVFPAGAGAWQAKDTQLLDPFMSFTEGNSYYPPTTYVSFDNWQAGEFRFGTAGMTVENGVRAGVKYRCISAPPSFMSCVVEYNGAIYRASMARPDAAPKTAYPYRLYNQKAADAMTSALKAYVTP